MWNSVADLAPFVGAQGQVFGSGPEKTSMESASCNGQPREASQQVWDVGDDPSDGPPKRVGTGARLLSWFHASVPTSGARGKTRSRLDRRASVRRSPPEKLAPTCTDCRTPLALRSRPRTHNTHWHAEHVLKHLDQDCPDQRDNSWI